MLLVYLLWRVCAWGLLLYMSLSTLYLLQCMECVNDSWWFGTRKVIALYCIAHPYCARFVASLARAHSAYQSRSQRQHSFWSAPRMQDLWDNQCLNADETKFDWLLKFTGSPRVRSFKTGNENVLRWFCWTFLITSERDSGERNQKMGSTNSQRIDKCSQIHIHVRQNVKREQVLVAWLKRKRRQNLVIRCSGSWQSWMSTRFKISDGRRSTILQ